MLQCDIAKQLTSTNIKQIFGCSQLLIHHSIQVPKSQKILKRFEQMLFTP